MKYFVSVLLVTYCFGCDIGKAPDWVCNPPKNAVVGYDRNNEKLAIAKAKIELAEIKKTHVTNEIYHKESSSGASTTTEHSLLTTKLSATYYVVDKWTDENTGIYVLVILK